MVAHADSNRGPVWEHDTCSFNVSAKVGLDYTSKTIQTHIDTPLQPADKKKKMVLHLDVIGPCRTLMSPPQLSQSHLMTLM